MEALTAASVTESNDSSNTGDVVLGDGLTLVAFRRVQLAFRKQGAGVVRQVDEWQLRETLQSLSRRLPGNMLQDRDLLLQRPKEPHKLRQNDPLATGQLNFCGQGADKRAAAAQELLDGRVVALGAVQLLCSASVEAVPFLADLQQDWAMENGSSSTAREKGEGPDTVVVRDIPSRWLAEPRVSSKPSMLVTHTLFSTFGPIRNVDVADEVLADEVPRRMPSVSTPQGPTAQLLTNVVVQYESHDSFCNAFTAFLGRALRKEGSAALAQCRVERDSSHYFSEKTTRRRKFERERKMDAARRASEAARQRAALAVRRLEEEKRAEALRQEALDRARLEEAERDRQLAAEEAEEARRRQEEEEAEEERLRLEEEEEERLRQEEEERLRQEEEERLQRQEEEERAQEARELVRQQLAVQKEREEALRQRRLQQLEDEEREERRRRQERKRGSWAEDDNRHGPGSRSAAGERAQQREMEARLRMKVEESLRGRGAGSRAARDDIEPLHGAGEERWRLDSTHSAASLSSAKALDQKVPAAELWHHEGSLSEDEEDAENLELGSRWIHGHKRLRSTVIACSS